MQALQIKPRSKGGIVKKEEDMSAEQLQTEHAAGRSNERLFGKHGILPKSRISQILIHPSVRQ